MKRDLLWIGLMIVAIALSFTLPPLMNIIQFVLCSFSLAVKSRRVWKRLNCEL